MASQSTAEDSARGWTPMAKLGLVLWVAFLLVNNAYWVRRHVLEFPPPWDQALYLRLSLQCARALGEGGVPALYHELVTGSRHVAPLFPLTAGLLHAALSEARIVAYMANGVYLAAMLAGVAGLAGTLYGRRAVPLAVFVASTFTGIVNYSRDCQMDFPGAALVTLGMWTLARSDRLRRPVWAAGAGAWLGLAALAKAMVVVFFAAPVLWIASSRDREPDAKPVRPIYRVLLVLAAAALVAAPWYAPNLTEITGYLVYYGFLEGAAPYRAAGPETFSFRNFAYYPLAVVNHGISFLYAALWLAASVAGATGRPAPADRGRATSGRGLLAAWIVGGYLILTLVPNKEGERYVLSLLPACAVLLAGGIASLAPRRRAAFTFAALAIGAFNYGGLTWGPAYPARSWSLPPFEIVSHEFPHYVAFRNSLGPGRPWPVGDAMVALEEAAAALRASPAQDPQVLERLESARRAGDREYVSAAYRLLLKREAEEGGVAAYLADLRRGALSHEGVVESLRLSDEYRERPLRVLVVPDHPALNASTLLYYATLERRALGFEGPRAGLDSRDGLRDFDAALVKTSGSQALPHVLPDVERLRTQLRREMGTRTLGSGFPCPDGSRLEIVVASGLP
jgi:hypothetical protein